MKLIESCYDTSTDCNSMDENAAQSVGQEAYSCSSTQCRTLKSKGSTTKHRKRKPSSEEKKSQRSTDNDHSDSSSCSSDLHSYIEKLENLALYWEQQGCEIFDQHCQNLLTYANELRTSFFKETMMKAEAMVKYLESTSIGHEMRDLELVEKIAWGVDYVEKSLEESQLSLAIQKALANACDRLLTYDELPEPWRENPYIIKGYKFNGSCCACIKSIFGWHNETANIWTHMIGIFIFFGLGLYHLPSTVSWQLGTWVDRLPMIVFVLAALKCLGCSVTWHSFCNISHLNTKRRMACIDYTGITVCICASILTTEYSILKCHPFAQAFYMFITLICGVFGVILNWHPSFDSIDARPMRALFFSCFAVFGGLCGLHACLYRGVAETLSYYVPVLKSLLCYGTGVIFYATLFPEKYICGVFDYCGMSHNLWHGFVLAGIYYHYKAMVEIFETAVMEVCPIK